MHLLLLCLCGVASYAVAEEAAEHKTSGAQHTRIFSLGSSGLLPISSGLVPAATTLLATPLATPYSFGGGFGLFPGNGGFHNNRPGQGYPNQGYPNQGYPNQGYPGAYPNNNNNFPGQQQQQGGSCRYWCKSQQNQYYCCEGQNQQIGGGGGGNVGTKQGFCPPVRHSCPPTRIHGPPRVCSNDFACAGSDKCCFDTCLQHHTCKPIQGYGR